MLIVALILLHLMPLLILSSQTIKNTAAAVTLQVHYIDFVFNKIYR